MINIIKNTKEQVTFEKVLKEESWFGHDCSDANLLHQCNRPNDTIERVKWDDGKYTASLLHVFFKCVGK